MIITLEFAFLLFKVILEILSFKELFSVSCLLVYSHQDAMVRCLFSLSNMSVNVKATN